ncbi:MAG: YcjX family protein [Dongiaceae bacterium]
MTRNSDDLGQTIRLWAQRLGASLEDGVRVLAERAMRRKLRIAVTGLAQAGKTVFLTSLLHNLRLAAKLGEGQSGHLPFFEPVAKERLDDVTLRPLADLPAFPFEENLGRLLADEPEFPPSTMGVSGFAASLRYRPLGFWGRQFADTTEVAIEIVDYPGEWLLDLPMLNQSFAQWSAGMLRLAQSGSRAAIAGGWRELSPDAAASEATLEAARISFTEFLRQCRADPRRLSFVQPGRFLRPGDGMFDVSAFRFCPLRPSDGVGPRSGTLAAAMAERFERYKSEIVQPFYREVFGGFDRQLVLVDVIGALNAGPEAFGDMRLALSQVLDSFRHGEDGLLARLFRPRTEKVLFAATKADHVTVNQFHNLRLLLRAMTCDEAGQLPVRAVEAEFAALSAVKCTSNKRVFYQDQQITVLAGQIAGHEGVEELFPGEIPEHLPGDADWAAERFRFYDFQPPSLGADKRRGIPHIAMDKALQFLTGDLFW